MKKIFLFLILLSFVGCTDEMNEFEQQNGVEGITMTVKNFEWENKDARTSVEVTPEGAIFKWAENDTVGIFPNEGAQAYFPMIDGVGSNSATFTGGGWALKSSSKYAAYYPYNFYNRDSRKIEVNYDGQMQKGNGSTAHLDAYDYMAAVATTPTSGQVNFDFQHLGCLVELNLILPDQGTLESLQLTADENIFTTQGYLDLSMSKIVPQKKTNKFLINCRDVKTSKANENVKLYIMLAPTNAKNKVVSVNLFNNGVNYTGSTVLKDFEVGKIYSLKIDITGQSNVFHIETPGTLVNQMSGVNRYAIKNLKVTGPLNSKDVIVIRDIAGVGTSYDMNHYTPGQLEYLDLSEARFVNDGDYYWDYTDYDIDEPWQEQFCTLTDILSEGMFMECSHLKQIVLPNNIIAIRGLAFSGCKSLQSIIIPSSVQFLECYDYYGGIFNGCENLQVVKLSSNITEKIPKYAFRGCKRLKSIEIPNNVKRIEMEAFAGCDSLTSVIIPDGVESIEANAFVGCDIEYIKLPKELKYIGSYAFEGNTRLSSLTLPEKVTDIGNDAFFNCHQLLNVCSLPSTPPTIHKGYYPISYSLGLPKNCTIYVPPYAVGDYKYAVGWNEYANNIKAK